VILELFAEFVSKVLMKQKACELLKNLTEAHGVPGFEDEVREIFIKELQGKGELVADRSGSVGCVAKNKGPCVLVAGHMDEVGFLVQNITVDGFLQFVSVGGWWTHTLLSQRVVVKTQSGEKILGVVSSKPPHFLPESQRRQVLPEDALFIDIGASSRQEVNEEFGINLGDPIAPYSEFTSLRKEGLFMAKAFDNRVGIAGAIQVFQELEKETIDCKLVSAGTVQEEVGLRGAKTFANLVKPDVALVLEGPPADDIPGFSKADSQGKLGGGVQIRLFDPSAIGNPRLGRLVKKIAEREGIRHQVTVRRSGGTDAGSFHLTNEGIPSVVLGVPSRYIHSHNAIIQIEDYLDMVKLAKAIVRELDEAKVNELFNYLG